MRAAAQVSRGSKVFMCCQDPRSILYLGLLVLLTCATGSGAETTPPGGKASAQSPPRISFVFFAFAAASPWLLSWRFGYTTAAWVLFSAGLICAFLGAGIGVLMAGGRAAVGGALSPASLFIVAVGVLFIIEIVGNFHC